MILKCGKYLKNSKQLITTKIVSGDEGKWGILDTEVSVQAEENIILNRLIFFCPNMCACIRDFDCNVLGQTSGNCSDYLLSWLNKAWTQHFTRGSH